uniref:Uncharacterized protein n=1 Tax=Oryza meridionalis TaxID=40149 RepID=A0A0E0DC98_9ORYZ
MAGGAASFGAMKPPDRTAFLAGLFHRRSSSPNPVGGRPCLDPICSLGCSLAHSTLLRDPSSIFTSEPQAHLCKRSNTLYLFISSFLTNLSSNNLRDRLHFQFPEKLARLP